MQLNTSVKWIKRNTENAKWQVCLSTTGREETRDFDKVVMCNGLAAKAVVPDFEGVEEFKAKIVHVQGFKRYVRFTMVIRSAAENEADLRISKI